MYTKAIPSAVFDLITFHPPSYSLKENKMKCSFTKGFQSSGL